MDLRLRPYKGKCPQLGKRVYVDPCATLVGDIELADDASIWPMVAARGTLTISASAPAAIFRMALCCT